MRDTDSRDVRQELFGLKHEHDIEDGWNQQFSYTLARNRENFHSPGVAPGLRDPLGIPPNSALSDYSRHELDWRLDRQLSVPIRLILGANLNHEDGDTAGQVDLGGFTVPSNFDQQ